MRHRLLAGLSQAIGSIMLIVALATPALGAANVQVLWSNEPSLSGLQFGDFNGDGRTDLFRVSGTQWQYSSAGSGPWTNLASDSTPQNDLRFGDFNGDGFTDVFSVSGQQWRYSPGGASNWVNLASDPTPLVDLRFGDFNGDGRTDVFSVAGTQWRYSASATSNWINIASDSTPLNDLRFGDFNGDGITDVFSVSGTQWRYSPSGASNWVNLASDSTPLADLRFGDFNGDGRTDVFSVSGQQWRYSAGGVSSWVNLASDPTPLANLRFGDFNGDGRTDVFSIAPDSTYRYSSAGASNWISLTSVTPTPIPSGPISQLRFGDFNGDGRTDVFRMSGTQWQYSSAGTGPWTNLASDSTPLVDLRFDDLFNGDPFIRPTTPTPRGPFNDFNADGRTDPFSVSGQQWRYSSAGASSWINLASDPTPLIDLRFGDFNGDGFTDVFSVSGQQWRYSAGGTSNWINLASDPTPLIDLRFGDFNGDGFTDVFSVSGQQWRYSPGGASNWVNLATDSTPLVDLRFGDFDGDGRTDVFSVSGQQWRYSPGGASNWVNLASDPTPLIDLRFGDFNGDGRMDVFSIAPDGRWRYSSGGASNWILLGPPDIVTPTLTPTWTPPFMTLTPVTPVTPTCTNVVFNSSFEQDGAWFFGQTPIPGTYTSAQAHSGYRSALLGNLPSSGQPNRQSYSSVRQLISIPPNAATVQLSWWHIYGSEEGANPAPSSNADRQDTIVLAANEQVIQIVQRVRGNEGTWTQSVADLSAYRGQTINIYFNAYNDGASGRTWMYLDDVTVNVCPGAWGPQPVPLPYPQPYPQPYPMPYPGQPYPPEQPMPYMPQGGGMQGGMPYDNMQGGWPQGGGMQQGGAQYGGPQYGGPQDGGGQYGGMTGGGGMNDWPDQSGGQGQWPTPTRRPTSTSTPTPTLTPTPPVSQTAPMTPLVSAQSVLTVPLDALPAMVVRVIDGQTVQVRLGAPAEEAPTGAATPEPPEVPAGPEGADDATELRGHNQSASYRLFVIPVQEQVTPESATLEPETLESQTLRTVRYLGIEAPALNEPYGVEAAVRNRELVEGQDVFLAADVMDADPYGRLLRYVFLSDGTFVNEVLVREGLATVTTVPGNSRYEALLVQAQAEAMASGAGIWAGLRSALPLEPLTSTTGMSLDVPMTGSLALQGLAGGAGAPVAQPALGQCVELVNNGNFEAVGPGWNMAPGDRQPVYSDTVTFNESDYAMRLGITDMANVQSVSAIDQTVALPGDVTSIVLSFRYYPIHEAEPGPGDLQYADIYAALTNQFMGRALGELNDAATWLTRDFDLTSMAGQSVRLVFAVNNDGVGGRTAMYVDNVSVLACNYVATPVTTPALAAQPAVGATLEATPTPEPSLLAREASVAEPAGVSPWQNRLFAGFVMLGVLSVIAFAAYVFVGTLELRE